MLGSEWETEGNVRDLYTLTPAEKREKKGNWIPRGHVRST